MAMYSHFIEPIHVWRMAGGDATRKGLAAAALPLEPQLSGALPLKGSVKAAPVFAEDGVVFAADRAGWAHSFSADGVERWSVELDSGVDASPALSDDDATLFVGTFGGWVHALDAASGETKWKHELPSQRDPRILADLLYHHPTKSITTSSWGGKFVMLDAETGESRHEWEAGIYPRAALAADPDGLFYGLRVEWNHGTRLFCAHPISGLEEILFQQPADSATPDHINCFAGPVIADDRLIAVFNRNNDSYVAAFNLTSGEMIRQSATRLPTFNVPPAILPTSGLRLAGMDGKLYSIISSGDSWIEGAITPLEAEYALSPVICDAVGKWINCTVTGKILLSHLEREFDLASLTERTVFQAPRSIEGRPAISPQGRLYVPCMDGKVYVFA